MGGFEQKEAPGRTDGARVSLVLSGISLAFASTLPAVCRGDSSSLTGVVYSLTNERVEVIAEGSSEDLDALVARVNDAVDAGTTVKEGRQLPVGGYEAAFPLVDLAAPTATASIVMTGGVATLDYISRHLQTEAVFNRGLKLKRTPSSSPEQLQVTCSGKSERLKSFVRWCYTGPPLDRPDTVKVLWE